jgi:hypothetical protein
MHRAATSYRNVDLQIDVNDGSTNGRSNMTAEDHAFLDRNRPPWALAPCRSYTWALPLRRSDCPPQRCAWRHQWTPVQTTEAHASQSWRSPVQTRGSGRTRDHHGLLIEYGGSWALTPAVASTASRHEDLLSGGRHHRWRRNCRARSNSGNHGDWISQSEGRRNLSQQERRERDTLPLPSANGILQRRQDEGGWGSGGSLGGVGVASGVGSGNRGGRAWRVDIL